MSCSQAHSKVPQVAPVHGSQIVLSQFDVNLRAAASVATVKGRKAGFDVCAFVDDLSWVSDVPGLNLGLDLLSDHFLEGVGLD